MSERAKKFDGDKPQLSLVPRAGLEMAAKAFAYGAGKYGRLNFKNGHEWHRTLDAALRHIYAMADGEWFDQESGNEHLAHAIASLMMLADAVKNKPELNTLNVDTSKKE